MRQKNTKGTVPLDAVPERRTKRFTRHFGSEVAFGPKFQLPVARQGGREMIGTNSYIYKTILLISSMCFIQVCLATVHMQRLRVRCCRNTLINSSDPL